MTEGGVDARLFRPSGISIRSALLFRRDHRKILVADRTVAFTGGMNIGDEYGSSLLPRESLWRDTHCRVEGLRPRKSSPSFFRKRGPRRAARRWSCRRLRAAPSGIPAS